MANIINSIQEPCKVIYLAACHNPEIVEANPWESWTVNVIGLNYLLDRMKKVAVFVFASTDAVYNESRERYRYTENDRPDPVSLYGIQKAAGESIVTHYKYHVFRYSLLMGPSLVEGKMHFFDIIRQNLQNQIPTELFCDAYRCMLDFNSAAYLTIRMIEEHMDKMPHILNVSGDDALTKYDIGIKLARQYNVPENLIIPIGMATNCGIFKTERATSILTDNTVLKKMLSMEHIRFVL